MKQQDNIIINVRSVINSPFCIDAADGQKIYELLYKALAEKNEVTLSFKGITLLITAFLNTAVGQLFRDFTEEEINMYLKKIDLNPSYEIVWDKVTRGAPIYYAQPDKVKKDIRDILED